MFLFVIDYSSSFVYVVCLAGRSHPLGVLRTLVSSYRRASLVRVECLCVSLNSGIVSRASR